MTASNATRVGARVLKFLDDHRLDHTPDHFAFAHSYLFGNDGQMNAEVRSIVDGGVRISPAEVQRIATKREAKASLSEMLAPQLDQVTVRVLDIIRDTLSATGDLNRDLVQASASLLAEDAPNVGALVAAMIERTATAERSLADATQQAQRLRAELNAIRSEANRDRLTGLLNRAAMEDHLAAAPKTNLSLALIDVDHFKKVNDTHGHGVGDRVLRAVAKILSETCAPSLVARWGGEEFLAVFETGDLPACLAVLDRARSQLSSKQLRLRENDQPLGAVTFSAGMVSRRGRTIEATIAAADALLYSAKAAGRNQIKTERNLVDVEAATQGFRPT